MEDLVSFLNLMEDLLNEYYVWASNEYCLQVKCGFVCGVCTGLMKRGFDCEVWFHDHLIVCTVISTLS